MRLSCHVCQLLHTLTCIQPAFMKPKAQTSDSPLVCLAGFFLYGPQMLIGLCGAELVGPESVGASEGVRMLRLAAALSVCSPFPLLLFTCQACTPFQVRSAPRSRVSEFGAAYEAHVHNYAALTFGADVFV